MTSLLVKSRVCVICGSGIPDTDEVLIIPDPPEISSSDFVSGPGDFFKGLYVFCDLLRMDHCFASSNKWTKDLLLGDNCEREGGVQLANFVHSVCCSSCGSLLSQLVSLQELVRSTQKSLEAKVHQVEDKIVKSVGKEEGGEYSIATCLEFREEVMRNFRSRWEKLGEISEDFRNEENVGLSYPMKFAEEDNFEDIQERQGTLRKRKLRSCFVKMERIHPEQTQTPVAKTMHLLATRNGQPSKRGRGRPRKVPVAITSEESKDAVQFPGDANDCLQQAEENFLNDHNTDGRDFDEFSNATSGFSESSSDDEWSVSVSTRKKKAGNHRSRMKDLVQPKRKVGRPPGSSKLRRIPTDSFEGTAYSRRAILILNTDTGTYSYMNVRLEMQGSSLVCRYPGCCFSTDNIGYFSQQSGFICIRKHVEEVHRISGTGESFIYECPYCDLQLEMDVNFHPQLLKGHLQTHEGSADHKVLCEICGMPVEQQLITGHMESHRNQEELTSSANMAEDEDNSKSKLTLGKVKKPTNHTSVFILDTVENMYLYKYVKIQRNLTTLHCKYPNCTYTVKNVAYFAEQECFKLMRVHIQSSHRVPGKPSIYECYRCDSRFPKSNLVKVHLKSIHERVSQKLKVLCEVCGSTLVKTSIMNHLRSHRSLEEKVANPSGVRKSNTVRRQYVCEECKKVFTQKHKFLYHKQLHVPREMRKVNNCEFCSASYVTKHALNTHVRAVHRKGLFKKPYVCPFCEREYPKEQKTCFDTHVRKHKGERPYQCAECGSSFGSKSILTRHEITHKGPLSLQCEFCSRSYGRMKSLKHHQKMHHSEFLPTRRGDARKATNPTVTT